VLRGTFDLVAPRKRELGAIQCASPCGACMGERKMSDSHGLDRGKELGLAAHGGIEEPARRDLSNRKRCQLGERLRVTVGTFQLGRVQKVLQCRRQIGARPTARTTLTHRASPSSFQAKRSVHAIDAGIATASTAMRPASLYRSRPQSNQSGEPAQFCQE